MPKFMPKKLRKGERNIMSNIINKIDEFKDLNQHTKGSLLTFGFDKIKIEKAYNLGIFDESTKDLLYTICDNKLLLLHTENSLIEFFDVVGRIKADVDSPMRGIRLGTYSGKHLSKSKVFIPCVTQLVSNNELDYFYRIGPWTQIPIQPAFRDVEIPENNYVFLCSSNFDLKILENKKDITFVSNNEIRTTSGRVYNIVRID